MTQSNIQPKKFGNKMRGDGVGKKLKKGRVSNIVMKYSFHKTWGLGNLSQLWITKIYKHKKKTWKVKQQSKLIISKKPLYIDTFATREFSIYQLAFVSITCSEAEDLKKKFKTREDTLLEIDQNIKILKS